MLILRRQKAQHIKIGEQITLPLTDIRDDGVRIGIDAPQDVCIVRQEMRDKNKNSYPQTRRYQ